MNRLARLKRERGFGREQRHPGAAVRGGEQQPGRMVDLLFDRIERERRKMREGLNGRRRGRAGRSLRLFYLVIRNGRGPRSPVGEGDQGGRRNQQNNRSGDGLLQRSSPPGE